MGTILHHLLCLASLKSLKKTAQRKNDKEKQVSDNEIKEFDFLWVACIIDFTHKDIETKRLLVDVTTNKCVKIDCNAQDRVKGNSLLHKAIQKSKMETIKFLVNECGASLITPINKDGFNPLQLSKRMSNKSEVDKEIYSFLRKK